MIVPGSRAHSPSPPPAPRFPVLGQTLVTDKPFIARLQNGAYVVLADGKVTSPLGAKTIHGRINLDAPDLDFECIRVRGDELQCDVPGMLEAAHPVKATPAAPGSPSPLRTYLPEP